MVVAPGLVVVVVVVVAPLDTVVVVVPAGRVVVVGDGTNTPGIPPVPDAGIPDPDVAEGFGG